MDDVLFVCQPDEQRKCQSSSKMKRTCIVKGEKIMQIACGTDIIEISRIKESIENTNEKFLEKIYTENEIK